MAGSRVHKSSNVFKRVQGLLKAEAIQWKDRPIWYDVMEKFPPKVPPAYVRSEPKDTVRKILYPEDLIRAKYYEEFSNTDLVNLKVFRADLKTKAQVFIEEYLNHQRPGATVDEIFNEVEAKLASEGKKYNRIKRRTFVEPTPLLYEEKVPEVPK